jgi:hypothetical protein
MSMMASMMATQRHYAAVRRQGLRVAVVVATLPLPFPRQKAATHPPGRQVGVTPTGKPAKQDRHLWHFV